MSSAKSGWSVHYFNGATIGQSITFNLGMTMVSSTGNVGIGTTSPSAKLDVAGTIRPQSATSGSACSPLGAQAYDSTTGAPLYCNNSSVWAAAGGSSVSSGTVQGGCAGDGTGWGNASGCGATSCSMSTTGASCPGGYTLKRFPANSTSLTSCSGLTDCGAGLMAAVATGTPPTTSFP